MTVTHAMDPTPAGDKRAELYRDRWSSIDQTSGISKLSERPSASMLKRFEIFQGMDDRLLEEISQDVSIATWAPESVLFEEGSYIDLAFFIAEGNVEVFLAKHTEAKQEDAPIFDVSRTIVLGGPGEPAPRTRAELAATLPAAGSRPRLGPGESQITYLSAMDFDLPVGSKMRLGAGEFFGEIGALNGWPQSATARTVSECVLVQIRLPALRRMKEQSKTLKERLDRLYRDRSLFFHMRQMPLFEKCDDRFIRDLVGKVDLVSMSPNQEVVREGEPADALYLVRSGFLKLMQRVQDGEIAVSYLSKGMTLGEVEMLVEGVKGWTCTTISVGYSELVKIAREHVKGVVERPEVGAQLWQGAIDRIQETAFSKRNIQHSELIEFSLDKGLVQGNSILVIDLNTCTRCDDCVRACADTHGGRPRFVREGDRYGNFMIARACYHCRDPVCLIGCPTGAIRRANVGDVVEIREDICIGCGNCASKCPYDAITMHPTGESWPQDTLPEFLRGKDRLVASKCDLCYTSSSGPACVRNCPQACAIRIGTIDEFQQLSTRLSAPGR